MKMTSQLSMIDMLSLAQGNFGAIQGLNRKIKNVLLNEMKGQDTPENRKKLADTEAEKFKSSLMIPDSLKENIYEGFDPLLVSHELADKHFILLLNTILNVDENKTSDAEFIE
jgi:hypothetical protein